MVKYSRSILTRTYIELLFNFISDQSYRYNIIFLVGPIFIGNVKSIKFTGFFSTFWFSFNLSLLICHFLFNPYLGWGGVIKVDDKDLSSLVCTVGYM